MPTPCFWMERTGKGEVALRRYHSNSSPHNWDCAEGWHDGHTFIGERVDYDIALRSIGGGDPHYSYPLAEMVFPPPSHDDSRWPTTCSRCDYEFTDDDMWQVWIEPVFTRTDNGEERALHWAMTPPLIQRAEPGAMWDAPWQQNIQGNPNKPDDDVWLMVRCPSISDGWGNDWAVDMRASSGGFWDRSGDPRNPSSLSVNPSIQTGDYHGFLRSGVLTDHVG